VTHHATYRGLELRAEYDGEGFDVIEARQEGAAQWLDPGDLGVTDFQPLYDALHAAREGEAIDRAYERWKEQRNEAAISRKED